MTKKDYVVLAEALVAMKRFMDSTTYGMLVITIGDRFRKDNPRFDNLIWYEACQFRTS